MKMGSLLWRRPSARTAIELLLLSVRAAAFMFSWSESTIRGIGWHNSLLGKGTATFLTQEARIVMSLARLKDMEEPPSVSTPVYSLATSNDNGSTNMNIVTYASPAAIRPERLWMMSLYKSTLSYENFLREGSGVLQLLSPEHARLVPVLGQSSGRNINKTLECAEESFSWEEFPSKALSTRRRVSLLPGCKAYITLEMLSSQPAGDHETFLCRVVRSLRPDGVVPEGEAPSSRTGTVVLTTQHLRDRGII